MTPAESQRFMLSQRNAAMADRPKVLPSEWCIEHLQFDEAGNHSPFSTHGREYVIDVLNDFINPLVTDETLVFGSQARKTGTMMGGVAYVQVNTPCYILWVMPTMQLARKFGRNRLGKMFKKSPVIRALIPVDRHAFSTTEMSLGASQLSIVGSNSASNLASAPCRVVILDEVEKFPEKVGDEADADSLAAQRTKDTPNPQRWRTSTPALSSGLIWQNYLKGNQMRYFLPCPGCRELILIVWSKNFTALPLTGKEAFIRWDDKARLHDGNWDLDYVKRTARLYCPFCKCPIEDGQKMKMIRGGKWIATNHKAPSNVVSRQLSSLYSPSPECSFGAMAVKFLQAKESLMGLQSFINGDLAEPYESQDKRGARVEIISPKNDKPEANEGWTHLMTVDCQNTNPHFYWLVRKWKQGNSEGIECGSCETDEDLRKIQEAHKIPDVGVIKDSGFDTHEVYRSCARFSQFEEPEGDGLPMAIGWMPAKGLQGDKRWKDEETGLFVPYCLRDMDPFIGTADAGQISMSLLEFASDFFKDILQGLREGKGGYKWSISEAMNHDEYWRHMDGEMKDNVFNKLTGQTKRIWKRRSSRWPNHWLDCENMQIAAASFLRLFAAPELETTKQ